MIRLTIPSAGKALHLFLVNHFHSQLPRLVELGTRIGSRDNIICFLAHRTGDFSAGIFDHLLGFIAGVVSQGSREDEALAGQLRATLSLLAGEGQTAFAQLLNELPIFRFAENFGNALSYSRTDLVYVE